MGKRRWNGYLSSMKLDNHKLSLGALEEVTYHLIGEGVDSASSPYNIYFDFERAAIKVTIRATVACSLTEWNGFALKSPLTINAGTNELGIGCSQFKIVSSASTVLEVTLK